MRLLSRIFSRRRRYGDISVSIEEHIEERIDELMADGLTRCDSGCTRTDWRIEMSSSRGENL
jgi:hypothetical protein